MSRYCPCGLDFNAPTPPGCGPRGKLGGDLSFCSFECLNAFKWLEEEDPAGARRLAQRCGADSTRIRFGYTGPTGPTGSAFMNSVIARGLAMRAALDRNDLATLQRLRSEVGLPALTEEELRDIDALRQTRMNPAVRAAYATFDVAVTRLVKQARAEQYSIPCADGCSHCCYDVAWAVRPEVDELAERVRSMPTAKRERVLARTRAWLAGMRAAGLDPDDTRPDLRAYHRARLACPLLEAGRCMAYDLRPLSCRAHYVIAPDARGCANRAEEPTITTLEMPDVLAESMARMIDWKPAELRDHLLPRLLGAALGVESLPERK